MTFLIPITATHRCGCGVFVVLVLFIMLGRRQDLGREKNWEKVCELMTPADKGIPASGGIYSSAIVAVAKSRRGSLALALEQVQACRT